MMMVAERQRYRVTFNLGTDAWAQHLEPGELAASLLTHNGAEYLSVTAIAALCEHLPPTDDTSCCDLLEPTEADDAAHIAAAVKAVWMMRATKGFTQPLPDMASRQGSLDVTVVNDRFRVEPASESAEAAS